MAADIKMFGGGCFPWPWYDFYDIYGVKPLWDVDSELTHLKTGRRAPGSWYFSAVGDETPQLMVNSVSEANALTGDGELDAGFGDHLYGTFAVRFLDLPNTNPEMLCANYCTGVNGIELRICADGKIKIYYNVTLLGTSSTSVGDGKWHIIDYKQDQPSSGAYELRIDGNSEVSGNTSITTNAISRVYLGKRFNRASESYKVLFDDMVWCRDDYVTYGAVVGPSLAGSETGEYPMPAGRYFAYAPEYDPDDAPYVPFHYWWEGGWREGGSVAPLTLFPSTLQEFYSEMGFWLTWERRRLASAGGIRLDTGAWGGLIPFELPSECEPIYAIRTSCLCKRSAATNAFKLFLRSNGSDYENDLAVSLNASLRYTYSQLWQQDPGRSIDWTAANYNSAEWGVHCIDGTVSGSYHQRFFEGVLCESGAPVAPGAMLIDSAVHILSAYAPRGSWTTWNLGG